MEIWEFLQTNLWWILLLIAAIFVFALAWMANFAYDNFKGELDENISVKTAFSGTTLEFANLLSQNFFGGAVKTKLSSESQDGYFSPAEQTVTLSEELGGQASVASIAIVAHEFGHAAQAYHHPQKLIKHYKFDRFVKFLGNLNPVLVILGVCLGLFVGWVWAAVCLALVMINFLVAICLKYSTAKLEKDASREAINLLNKTNIFTPEDIKHIKKFLAKAKRTYTADFLFAILGWTGLVRRTKFF